MTAPTPVDTARLKAVLTGRELCFDSASDNVLVIPSNSAVYFIDFSNPQVLQMRAQWRGEACDQESFTALAQQVSECNSTRTGPKAYMAPFENGEAFSIVAETNILSASGLTPAQLDAFFESSMTMMISFFNDVEQACPQLVTWEKYDAEGGMA